MKRVTMGILAHVDAGKTTLSEALLYCSGVLKKLGRVDHQDAFLDTNSQERERGITIFSKQAELETEHLHITLLDTPGHVDFSSEMERTLQVLDYAILVISGTDGIQGHTETLWKLLQRYQIPTFIFVNKMDLQGVDPATIFSQISATLSDGCVDFTRSDDPVFLETVALCDETLMNAYLESGTIPKSSVQEAIVNRKVFPCWFGSALHLNGISEFIQGLETWVTEPEYGSAFGASVFKISRDNQDKRLTWLKVTGGTLRVKDLLTNAGTYSKNGLPVSQEDAWHEKVDQIRIYSGSKFKAIDAAPAGTVCAVTGLKQTWPGQGLGARLQHIPPTLEPLLTYGVHLPRQLDPIVALKKLRELEDEDPMLRILWDEGSRRISLQLMGEIQLEILKQMIADRFGWDITFSKGTIRYKETLSSPVEGVGHYEPLRHYAEVHLLLEPGERGSGLVFDSACSTDLLDLNWQRLILTHLEEKTHLGVLTGAPITDLKITLVTGKAHQAHTEGGDFRQATYRAVRQGLMSGESVLLEPWYQFRLELPQENLGRAMNDIQQRFGTFESPEIVNNEAILVGTAPVSTMSDYITEVNSYTKGRGKLSCSLRGYDLCHNTDEVLAASNYFPEADLENTPDSVFCSHGAGTIVPWDQVRDFMHLEGYQFNISDDQSHQDSTYQPARPAYRRSSSYTGTAEEDKELQAIFEQTYGSVQRPSFRSQAEVRAAELQKATKRKTEPLPTGPEYLLVDGYNIIFAWDELKAIANSSLDDARIRLADILCNYQGYKQCRVILVFDAYKVKGNPGSVETYKNISIVYTKEAETADTYIERVTYEIGKKHRVRVASSDGMEQVIILGHGALRQSASAFRLDVNQTTGEIDRLVQSNNSRIFSGEKGHRVTRKKGGD